ncbi:MAG: Sec-independent protein translocase subunit TatB [Pseudonocardia sp.]|uniref:twin-arginine translocase TatA/TatE family subunit n=1 Tax=Pseudonocardia sp. TaxID=60912 RepID=UPI001AC9E6D6|nr:twin-arginine translocase TatA/TatE family subunit [Pseudonocardia sp.]MBN9098764.1 Sec-independent protein translocase subunit TatB [Pseudonocardia sp.]
MFDLSIGKIMVLVLVALFVLGPERLPAAAAWAGKAIRQVKSFATGANERLRDELGPEFDQLREPLAELRAPLQELRALRDPRAAVVRHLFNDTDPLSEQPASTSSGPAGDGVKPVTGQQVPAPATLARNEAPPIDLDAT